MTMKYFKNMNTTRRDFLKGIGKGALTTAMMAAPFWARNVFAQTANKKVLFLYHPDGSFPDLWHPSGTETNFTLPAMTSPLESVKQHCVFVEGLEMVGSLGGHDGMGEILTADNDFSLDYFLGEQLGGGFPFKSIQLGVSSNRGAAPEKRMTILPGSVPVAANDDPNNAFETIFGSGGNSIERDRANSVLVTAREDLNALRTKLGTQEQAKLDEHENAILDVQARINDVSTEACDSSGWNPEGFGLIRPGGWPSFLDRDENFDVIAKLQMDIIVLAFKCGMTPVSSLTFSREVSPFKLPGFNSNHHQSSHHGGDQSGQDFQEFIAYKQYWCQQLAYLINSLAATPDTDGNSLLDNTLILMGSAMGDGNRHNQKNMPFVMAGGAGGALTTGRYLQYAEGTAHSKLLVSVANKMGVNIDSFGNTESGTGGLAGL
ncbi:MAG: hypothetical protein COA42_18460 [Alteromonadaceae bacterium]|nr:MAG: hypothetical protein COA42_18460 [Alteromonadaceae bacterium]